MEISSIFYRQIQAVSAYPKESFFPLKRLYFPVHICHQNHDLTPADQLLDEINGL
jgi:hypothetical protein